MNIQLGPLELCVSGLTPALGSSREVRISTTWVGNRPREGRLFADGGSWKSAPVSGTHPVPGLLSGNRNRIGQKLGQFPQGKKN